MAKFLITTTNRHDVEDNWSEVVRADNWQEAFDNREGAELTTAADYDRAGEVKHIPSISIVYGMDYTVMVYKQAD